MCKSCIEGTEELRNVGGLKEWKLRRFFLLGENRGTISSKLTTLHFGGSSTVWLPGRPQHAKSFGGGSPLNNMVGVLVNGLEFDPLIDREIGWELRGVRGPKRTALAS